MIETFRLSLECPTDNLAELKIIGTWVTRFPRTVEGRTPDRMAERLSQLYNENLQTLDRRFYGWTRDQRGTLETRLDSFLKLEGLVVGASGEVNKDMKSHRPWQSPERWVTYWSLARFGGGHMTADFFSTSILLLFAYSLS